MKKLLFFLSIAVLLTTTAFAQTANVKQKNVNNYKGATELTYTLKAGADTAIFKFPDASIVTLNLPTTLSDSLAVNVIAFDDAVRPGSAFLVNLTTDGTNRKLKFVGSNFSMTTPSITVTANKVTTVLFHYNGSKLVYYGNTQQ